MNMEDFTKHGLNLGVNLAGSFCDEYRAAFSFQSGNSQLDLTDLISFGIAVLSYKVFQHLAD